ncbi:hypothetical protein VTN00DRAFT_3941 [Thermoascus crustaceus]|uniref:uncharacterized protein n=1 Tax=Thermoascus crustaceus TaxID=5088 RepID=UPI003742C419
MHRLNTPAPLVRNLVTPCEASLPHCNHLNHGRPVSRPCQALRGLKLIPDAADQGISGHIRPIRARNVPPADHSRALVDPVPGADRQSRLSARFCRSHLSLWNFVAPVALLLFPSSSSLVSVVCLLGLLGLFLL